MSELKTLKIHDINLDSLFSYKEFKVSYQIFGKKIGTNPIVLVLHPLTGNSDVAGRDGWWKKIIYSGGPIDTKKYTIISFNIPGNGYDGIYFDNYKDFNTSDIARIIKKALEKLNISKLHTAIGGSIGAGLCWELATLFPNLIRNLIPIAGDWKSTDWMIANTTVQNEILNLSKDSLNVARMHAMLCYRTPVSFRVRFNRSYNDDQKVFNVQSWLYHHGEKLKNRFDLRSYKMMNHLLGTIDITRYGEKIETILKKIQSKITIISIDSDLFFPLEEDIKTIKIANKVGVKIDHEIINSVFGHDAFLMEYSKLSKILKNIFK